MGEVSMMRVKRWLARWLGAAAGGLLGLAVAFFCLVVPAGILRAAGLPEPLIAWHIPAGLVLAAVLGLATWRGFALFDRPGTGRPLAVRGGGAVAPVLRRADAHPDAPARRPIFAGSDLGTPLDQIAPLPGGWATIPEGDAAATGAIDGDDDVSAIPEAEIIAPADTPLPTLMLTREIAPPVVAAPVAPATPVVAAPPPEAAPESPPESPAAPAASLAALLERLETGIVAKELKRAGAEPNVTALRREIRPVGGSLIAAVDHIQQKAAARR